MTTSASDALQARVHKLLGSRAEFESTQTLLTTLIKDDPSYGASIVQLEVSTGLATPSLAPLRRNLRSNLETQQLLLAEKALTSLEQTLHQVSNLVTQVDMLDYKCDQVHKFLETTKRETQQVQTEASILATKRDTVQNQWQEIKTFLSRYQLTEEEVHRLSTDHLTDNDMDAFFSTFERVQQVKEDCKALVAEKDVACGSELLTTLCKYQEAGMERLCQWTNEKCTEINEEPHHLLHRALALLSDCNGDYNHCKVSLTLARQSLIVHRFMMALTVGGPNGIPRPIEMHAHDPVRYCGDMLAWIHQAIATEKEFFRVLFNDETEFRPPATTGSAQMNSRMLDESFVQIDTLQTRTDDVAKESCTSMVGCAFDGVARPLQVRIEHTLTSPHGIVIAYKLVHLLAFYHHKFDQLVAHADVARALRHCREVANEAFRYQFQQLMDAVAASAQDYTANLAATHVTLDVSHRLVTLLEVFQTSLLSEQEKEADLAPLFNGVLSAVEMMCQRSVAGLDLAEALIFRINNFSCLHAPLTQFPEATKWYTKIGHDLECWLRDLSELEASHVMNRCGVAALLQHIQDFQQSRASITIESGTLPTDTPGLDGETITRVMGSFCAALTTLLLPQLGSVAQPALSDKARALTSATLAGTYAFIYEFVHDARNGYLPSHEPMPLLSTWSSDEQNRRVMLQHTPEEIRTVLEIDGDEAKRC